LPELSAVVVVVPVSSVERVIFIQAYQEDRVVVGLVNPVVAPS